MTNICAALGVAQLEQADKIIQKKMEVARWYKTDLKDYPLSFQSERAGVVSSHWMVAAVATDGVVRDKLCAHLRRAGIETRPLFYPVHTMPVFRSSESFPVAESLSQRGLNLPSYPDLGRGDVRDICSEIKECYDEADN
jgi:perosamine synthetase